MFKCKTCGRRFRLLAKNRYEVVRIPTPLKGLLEETVYFNAFDCPHCGCQNVVGVVEKHIVNDTPLTEVVEDITAEIKKNILDEPAENGTNSEMVCYNSGLLKCLEIIGKHISAEGIRND